jgi:hypothetical protein
MASSAGGWYPSDECGRSVYLGLGEAVEDLAVEQFVAKLRVEALAVAVLPRASGLDERGLRAD